MSIAKELADFICTTRFPDLPPRVVQTAKECLLDIIGGTLGGTSYPDVLGVTNAIEKYDYQSECVIWGTNKRMSLFNATIINGITSHATEMDDVHKTAKIHAGTALIPAAVTFGEVLNSSGKDLILAVALGYEVALRCGIGIGATSHRQRGWNATGTCGVFGAAVATAKLLGLEAEKMTSAIGIAGMQSSGLWAYTEDGASCKKFIAGKSAYGGLIATIMAAGGMTGPSYIFEAEDGGLFPAASDDYSYDIVTEGLGETWEILNVDRKPFACARSMHPSIDAIIQLQNKYNIVPEDIKQIHIETYEVAVKQCAFTDKPKNVSEAQFCIPYGVAVALYDKCAGIEQFTSDRIRDDRVLNLAKRVQVYATPAFTNEYPKNWGCKLNILTYSGQSLQKHIVNAKGDHDNPLTFDDLVAKFKASANKSIPEPRHNLIIDMIMQLESISDASRLVGMLSLQDMK